MSGTLAALPLRSDCWATCVKPGMCSWLGRLRKAHAYGTPRLAVHLKSWVPVLGAGCWVLGAGCWVLGAGCWVLGAGCWVLGAGVSVGHLLSACPAVCACTWANPVFILSTSENFPDVMLPAYKCSRFSAIFFILFFVIGVYFLLNLVLAVAYTEFMERTKDKVAVWCLWAA